MPPSYFDISSVQITLEYYFIGCTRYVCILSFTAGIFLSYSFHLCLCVCIYRSSMQSLMTLKMLERPVMWVDIWTFLTTNNFWCVNNTGKWASRDHCEVPGQRFSGFQTARRVLLMIPMSLVTMWNQNFNFDWHHKFSDFLKFHFR